MYTNNMNIKNSLLNLGFTANDAEVYVALIKIGASTADSLIKETGLHRNLVYTALTHLVARKLATEQTVKNKKHFSPNTPQFLIDEFTEKTNIARDVAEEIEKSIPKDKQEITIHQGNDEYLKLLTSLIKRLPKGATKYIMGTGGDEFMKNTMLPIWKKYHNVAFAQEIKIKMISYEDQKSSIEAPANEAGIYEIKYLSSNTENPAGIHIYPEVDTVLNIIYSDSSHPVTAIMIKNRALTQSYLNLFNNLWKTAKEA